MVGTAGTGTLTLLNFPSWFSVALACWILIGVDVGSTKNLAGAKTLKLDKKCKRIAGIKQKSTQTLTSILCGPTVSNMVTIASMLLTTKH